MPEDALQLDLVMTAGPSTVPPRSPTCRVASRPQFDIRIFADMACRPNYASPSMIILLYSRWWDAGLIMQPRRKHDYCDPELRDWASRGTRLLEEILAYSADILCLQEVQRTRIPRINSMLTSPRVHQLVRPGCVGSKCTASHRRGTYIMTCPQKQLC